MKKRLTLFAALALVLAVLGYALFYFETNSKSTEFQQLGANISPAQEVWFSVGRFVHGLLAFIGTLLRLALFNAGAVAAVVLMIIATGSRHSVRRVVLLSAIAAVCAMLQAWAYNVMAEIGSAISGHSPPSSSPPAILFVLLVFLWFVVLVLISPRKP